MKHARSNSFSITTQTLQRMDINVVNLSWVACTMISQLLAPDDGRQSPGGLCLWPLDQKVERIRDQNVLLRFAFA